MFGDEMTVQKLPPCDFCKSVKEPEKRVLARYDGKTKKGAWRKMCLRHFKEHGIGVGVNKGMRLWLPHEKHAPGEVPVKELPSSPPEPVVACDICGKDWFLRVVEILNGKSFCPKCLRACFPLRTEGPFTFGDMVTVTYPADHEWAGEWVGRVLTIPEQNVIEVRFENEDTEVETIVYALDGIGRWIHVSFEEDGELRAVRIRYATAPEAAQYERWRKQRIDAGDDGRAARRNAAVRQQASLFE
jgi:hypothetical protein